MWTLPKGNNKLACGARGVHIWVILTDFLYPKFSHAFGLRETKYAKIFDLRGGELLPPAVRKIPTIGPLGRLRVSRAGKPEFSKDTPNRCKCMKIAEIVYIDVLFFIINDCISYTYLSPPFWGLKPPKISLFICTLKNTHPTKYLMNKTCRP